MNLVTMILACSLYPDNSITNAMVQLGSQNNPLTISVSHNGQMTTKTFKTEAEALSYTNKEIAQGYTVNIGLLQVPNGWIAKYPASMGANVAGLLRPCKNMVVATDLLNDATEQCASVDGDKTACALSLLYSGSTTAGLDYAKQIINYAVAHPFVKPPSILEQVPATPDNTAIENANNALQGDLSNSNNALSSNSSTNNNSTTNNSKSDNLNNNLQQASAQSPNNDTNSSDQNTDQSDTNDQQNLPSVVEGNN